MSEKKHIVDILRERGCLEDSTGEALYERLKRPVRLYCGFDPTSDSLHVGNLLPMIVLARFQRCGHQPVVVLGGATGKIGDPGGKSVERPLLDLDVIQRNIEGIRRNFERLFDTSDPKTAPLFLNNDAWFGEFPLIDFLRDVGRHYRVNAMLAKEGVRTRLESQEGISFTEFSYMLMQGYDFLHLFRDYGVELQIGGSDQWGNITSGIDLVRRVCGEPVHGLTLPLLTRSDGKKFGKSEGGAVWLSREKLPVYDFYQYFMRLPDADVGKLMRFLTFMELEEIRELEAGFARGDLPPNALQKRLAEEMTRFIHGQEGLEEAQKITEQLAPGAETELSAQSLEALTQSTPSSHLMREEVVGKSVVDVLVAVGLQPSKGAARRLVDNGGVYLNNLKVTEASAEVSADDLVDGKYLLLAVGKKNKHVVSLRD